MKVGIVVVYLVSEENEKLLDLHLSQIEKHTQVPYTIYGSVNRLLPKFQQKLELNTNVRICDCPSTDLRGDWEQSYYLEQLVRAAIEDGVTHVITMHVDSFPVRSDWIDVISGELSYPCVLAAVQESEYTILLSTACMAFHRDFYLDYSPSFLPTPEDRSLPEFDRFFNEYDRVIHSGTGYAFKAYLHGLSWHAMLRSNKGEDHHRIASIYDDIVFHLGAAAREEKIFMRDIHNIEKAKVKNLVRRPIWKAGSALLSQRMKARIKETVPRWMLYPLPMLHTFDVNQHAFERIARQLFLNPESYIHYLRTGQQY